MLFACFDNNGEPLKKGGLSDLAALRKKCERMGRRIETLNQRLRAERVKRMKLENEAAAHWSDMARLRERMKQMDEAK